MKINQILREYFHKRRVAKDVRQLAYAAELKDLNVELMEHGLHVSKAIEETEAIAKRYGKFKLTVLRDLRNAVKAY